MVINNELTSSNPNQLVQGQKYPANKATAGMVTVPSSGHGEKLGYPLQATAIGQARGKQGGTLRNCVYYQNRFIILDPLNDKTQLASVTAENSANKLPPYSHGKADDRLDENEKVGRRQTYADTSVNESTDLSFENYARVANTDSVGRTSNKTGSKMEMDASSVTMVPRGIEVFIDDGEGGSPKRMQTGVAVQENSPIWKKIWSLLQDNRMKGRSDWEDILNSTRPEDHRMLKKVLNIIFLTIGVSLLLSVIIVVIYASVVEGTQGPYIPPGSNDLPTKPAGEGQNNSTWTGDPLNRTQSVNFDSSQKTYLQ